MTTPVLWQSSDAVLEASALVAKLETLLCSAAMVDWPSVLPAAIALKCILLRDPKATELCMYIDTNVLYRCYLELQCPAKAAEVLEEVLSRSPVLPCAGPLCQAAVLNGAIQAEPRQLLKIRRQLHSCYQACIEHVSVPGALPPLQQIQHHAQPPQQQQPMHEQPMQHHDSLATQNPATHSNLVYYKAAAISNSRQILQLATFLQDQQQQAAAAADLAELYEAAGDAAAARQHYEHCLQTCSAAASQAASSGTGGSSSSSSSWIQEMLCRVVSAAVDINIAAADTAGARAVLISYNNIQLALGRSACEECAVCYEGLTGSLAVTLLACGHLFHRHCCNEWFGTKLYECGRFQPECPMCRQIDEAIKPSEAALRALEELQQYHTQQGSSSSEDESNSSGDSSEEGSSSETESVTEGERPLLQMRVDDSHNSDEFEIESPSRSMRGSG